MNTLVLSSTDNTLLIILVVLLSLFFLLSVVAVALIVRILLSINRVVGKAESVIDNVEAAAEVLKETSGSLSVIKLIQNIFEITKRKK